MPHKAASLWCPPRGDQGLLRSAQARGLYTWPFCIYFLFERLAVRVVEVFDPTGGIWEEGMIGRTVVASGWEKLDLAFEICTAGSPGRASESNRPDAIFVA